MGLRKVLLGLLLLVVFAPASSAEAARIFRFMPEKNPNTHHTGKRLPFSSFDGGYYSTRYPFNRYYTQQAHGYHGFPKYNR